MITERKNVPHAYMVVGRGETTEFLLAESVAFEIS